MAKAKVDVYQIVTERIIKKLEQGVAPWRRPWNSKGVAVNWKTQRPYRGINTLMLEPGEYATYKQIKEAGGKVKTEERKKWHMVVFWKWLEIEDEDKGETVKVPFLRYYRAYEINTQVEGLRSKRVVKENDHNPLEEAEEIFKGYINAPDYTFESGSAYYQPRRDRINVPPLKDFDLPEEYYCTLFHEMVHSTGHRNRLNRPGIEEVAAFGSEVYSKEELVAEMGAAMLCGVAGIDNSTIDNSASYIAGWLEALKNDKRMVAQAAAQAQKAADYILGKSETEAVS